MGRYRAGINPYINVLQAIVDWGNSVSAEAQALTQYNTALARLQRETGTILETHGIRFYEERYGSIGPLGRLFPDVCYPKAMRPTENDPMYPTSEKPSEDFFQLEDPLEQGRRPPLNVEELPPLRLPPVESPSAPPGGLLTPPQ
jgi:hypothetical protein